MALRTYNVLSDVPEDLIGVYDLVHIRNFSFVLKDNEIKRVMENLLMLLKPGGYLQWAEPDMASFRIEKTRPENKAEALTELIRISQGQDARLSPTWVSNLPNQFQEGGFEQVQADTRNAPGYMALAMHECNLIIHELLVRKTKNTTVKQELTRLIPEAAQETRDGSCWAFTRWSVVGKKAA
ncbi:hypothetical protein QQS21_000135 [Conoideocrella luteorostrata]|uniref:Uncharacterized protein n=1 Tax=Conoideocrella luteorostrata TaxID=1105319 RepID=A0AAJ0CZN7_9HYPO|nr:hypothetical protein QQS21_000135 [Conoideocrella luteorostrata]